MARQYTGTSGKIDNCQLGVFMAYASSAGRALVDRELYLPRSWTEDPERCRDAGVPDQVEFATKPQLGVAMLARAHQAGVLSGWVTADEVYGQHRGFREWLADHRVPFVLATRSDDTVPLPTGRRRAARSLVTDVPTSAWERRSAGAHGLRLYDWATLALDPAGLPDGWGHWLLIRRQIPTGDTAPELAFYRCAGPIATPITELIRVAGARWAIEETFQTAKNEAGLDHYQARHYTAWYRHITLAMLATVYLAVTRAEKAKKGIGSRARRADPLQRQRDPPAARHRRPGPRTLPDHPATLVPLATTPPTPGPRLPLPPTRPPTPLNCRCSTTRDAPRSWRSGMPATACHGVGRAQLPKRYATRREPSVTVDGLRLRDEVQMRQRPDTRHTLTLPLGSA